MELKIGDKVRVRFTLSKINGMDRFVEGLRVQGKQIPESYPIGYAHGTVVNKSYWHPSANERSPIAVVLFDKNQIVCNALNVSSERTAISTAEGPDYYGARIVDEAGNVYTE